MYKLCVFAGTTEGRELVEFLSGQPVSVTACVATEYGQTLLHPGKNLTISAQRLTREEMEDLFQREAFDLVVDATHPYASVVTENIAAACQATGREYLRLNRSASAQAEEAVFVENISAAVAYLDGTQGSILLTTGSKELSQFAALRGFSQRVYARVLPMEESLHLCRKAGLPPAHILAMQGPFSREMNTAMLRWLDGKYLVTKDSGTAGGFDEKRAAARDAGAKLVVIGRPPQRAGLSFGETLDLLCRRFGWEPKPQVTIVGIGPGNVAAMTLQAQAALARAECIIGARRMVEAVAQKGQALHYAIDPEAIASFLREQTQYHRFAVVMSGDVGFFSGTKKLLPLLDGWDVTVLPGISSLVYLCAKLGTSYEDVIPISIHGRDHDLIPDVRRYPRIFTLAGGENGIGKLCRALTEAGLGDVQLSVGQDLSYPQEQITVNTAAALADRSFSSLSVALIENPGAGVPVIRGLPDRAFRRAESVPMTKSEVRAICLSKLALTENAVAWDVGAGSGSVAIEMALSLRNGRVYAIERKPEALDLLVENCQRLGAGNVKPVPGPAPAACESLPPPTHVFIGGSGGNLKDILTLILEKNPEARIVATAISLESAAELTQWMKHFREAEVVSVTVAKNKKAGSYNLMTGQNPIFIFTMQGGNSQCGPFVP